VGGNDIAIDQGEALESGPCGQFGRHAAEAATGYEQTSGPDALLQLLRDVAGIAQRKILVGHECSLVWTKKSCSTSVKCLQCGTWKPVLGWVIQKHDQIRRSSSADAA
jgi:hypothetical protein